MIYSLCLRCFTLSKVSLFVGSSPTSPRSSGIQSNPNYSAYCLDWTGVDKSFFKMTAPLPLRRDAKVMQTNPGFDMLWRFPMEDCTGGHPCRFQKLLLRGLGSGTEHKLSTKTAGDKHGCGELCLSGGLRSTSKACNTPRHRRMQREKGRFRLWGCCLSQRVHQQERQ